MKKAKKFLSFVLSLAILMSFVAMSGITAYAESTSGTCGANITWEFDEQTGRLTISGSGKMNDFQVYNVPWLAFKDSVIQVVFEGKITSVGEHAFYRHKNLTTVTLNDDIKLISDGAFWCSEKLENINLPEALEEIGEAAFRTCNSLKTITIPANVVTIGDAAFANCANLVEIKVVEENDDFYNDDNGILYYDDTFSPYIYLIQYPAGKTETLFAVPDGVNVISEYAFAGSIIETVTFPISLGSIKPAAFLGCEKLEKVYMKNYSGSQIGISAFSRCDSITDVYYTGTEDEWNAIKCSEKELLDADIHFNYYCEKEHIFGDWKIIEDPCGSNERARRICIFCEEQETVYTGNVVGHKLMSWTTKKFANCTSGGIQVRICFKCMEEVDLRYTEPLGHSFTEWVVKKEPNCTDDGVEISYCTTCKREEGNVLIATGHDEGEWIITKPATQTQSGVMDLLCTECGFKLDSKIIDAYGKVNYVLAESISLNYKCSTTITPTVNADAGVDYTISYTSSDDSVARVDENGNVYAAGVGNAVITVTVTDEYGTVVIGTCNADVSYSWWQWIIYVVLFGWIWY